MADRSPQRWCDSNSGGRLAAGSQRLPTLIRLPLIVLLIFGLLLLQGRPSPSWAQQAQITNRQHPQIQKIIGEISTPRIEASMRKLVGFGTRHTLSSPEDPVRGIGAARRWIREELERVRQDSAGRLVVEEDAFLQPPTARVKEAVRIVNLVATLPGSQPASKDRIVVVAAHYDSICFPYEDAECDAPGASDDASGTAAVLEMARVMSKYEFDATLVFLLVAGEEQGLLGSTHWVEEAKRKQLQITAMITNDIVGNTNGGNGVRDNARLRVFSEGVPSAETPAEARLRQSVGGENDSPSRQLARYIKEIAERYLPPFDVTLVFRRDRFGRGGDHIPFLQAGYPAVRFTEPNEDFSRQHQRVRQENGQQFGDVIEMVDFDYIAKVARVNAIALAGMALAPAAPAGVTFRNARQQYDAVLTWQAGAEPDLAGYRVVWRETYQPFWQRSLDVGLATEVTLQGLSKDDYFFGVQSLDRDGNASVPVFPRGR
ncbi:MAG: M20/M25/M40 family metallo-hydrolase [Blastocatellia bacterium]